MKRRYYKSTVLTKAQKERKVEYSELLDVFAERQFNMISAGYGKISFRQRSTKFLSLYLKLMIGAVLRGYRWELPKNFGEIKIHTKERNGMSIASKNYGVVKYEGLNKEPFNPKAPDVIFSIKFHSDFLKKHNYTFIPANSLKAKLFKGLYHGDLAYELKQTRFDSKGYPIGTRRPWGQRIN